MDLRGYLHSKGNNCTGKSRSLFALFQFKRCSNVRNLRTVKVSYRIREVFRSLFFIFFFNTDEEKRKNNAL